MRKKRSARPSAWATTTEAGTTRTSSASWAMRRPGSPPTRWDAPAGAPSTTSGTASWRRCPQPPSPLIIPTAALPSPHHPARRRPCPLDTAPPSPSTLPLTLTLTRPCSGRSRSSSRATPRRRPACTLSTSSTCSRTCWRGTAWHASLPPTRCARWARWTRCATLPSSRVEPATRAWRRPTSARAHCRTRCVRLRGSRRSLSLAGRMTGRLGPRWQRDARSRSACFSPSQRHSSLRPPAPSRWMAGRAATCSRCTWC